MIPEFAALPDNVLTYIRGLEIAIDRLQSVKAHSTRIQETIICAHSCALPDNWVYQDPFTTIDLLVAEITTLRAELKRATRTDDPGQW